MLRVNERATVEGVGCVGLHTIADDKRNVTVRVERVGEHLGSLYRASGIQANGSVVVDEAVFDIGICVRDVDSHVVTIAGVLDGDVLEGHRVGTVLYLEPDPVACGRRGL